MRKDIISESRLREIISEEATRFKKKLTLEAEKKKILNRLQEMYMEEEVLDEVEEAMPTESDVQKLLANLPYTPEEAAQAIQQDPEVLDAIKNPKEEAKRAEQLAAKLFPLNEEEAGQTIAENPKEFKIRFGKILKGLGIAGAAAAILLGAVSVGIASGGIAGGFALATPMAYSAALSFALGAASTLKGAKEVQKGYGELAKNVAEKDSTFLNLLGNFKQAQNPKDRGSIMLKINNHLTKVAEDNKINGLAANQQLGFIDAVKKNAKLPTSN